MTDEFAEPSPPPPLSIWPEFRRRPFLALVPVIILTAAGLAYGLARNESYTASASVIVGNLSVSANNLPSSVTAAETLATTFAGLVGTAAFDDQLAPKLTPAQRSADVSLSANAVPGSTIVYVEASSANRSYAIAEANAGGQVLVTYGNQLAQTGPPTKLLSQYTAASRRLSVAQLKLSQDESDLSQARQESSSSVGSLQSQVVQDHATVSTLQLRASILGNSYTQLSQSSASGQPAQVAGGARVTGTTRNRNIEVGVAAGVILGFLVSFAFLAWSGGRRRKTALVASHDELTDGEPAKAGRSPVAPATPGGPGSSPNDVGRASGGADGVGRLRVGAATSVASESSPEPSRGRLRSGAVRTVKRKGPRQ